MFRHLKTAVSRFLRSASQVSNLKSRPLVICANIAEGTHGDGCISKKADAVIATRNLLVKQGSDVDHIAVTTAASEIAMGVVDDEAAAIEDNVNVQLLGNKQGTILMVSDGTISANDLVTPTTGGKVAKLGTAGGSYYIIGRAMNTASGSGDLVEVQHCVPVLRVV